MNKKKCPWYVLFSLFLSMMCSINTTQAQCTTAVSGTIAEFNFNSTPPSCSGANPRDVLRPRFRADRYTYCPNVSADCGSVILGSTGHANTGYFQNAICALNFYDVPTASGPYGGTADYDPTSSVFDPSSPANFYLRYTVPQGGGSCIDNFSIVPVQYMYDGSTLNFEKMGMGVYRNGLLIHSETQNITASNVNGTPVDFSMSGSEFCTDGSQVVVFEIVFGFVKQLVVGGALSLPKRGLMTLS